MDASYLWRPCLTLAYAVSQFIEPSITVVLAGNDNNFNAGMIVAGIGLLISLILLLLFRRQPQSAN